MKENIVVFLISVLLVMVACSDMNDVHGGYLTGGERVYIGKVDSIKVFPGNERVMLRFWASDPRVKSATFYWIPDDDSLFYEMERVSPRDSFEVMIGGETNVKSIKEGSYTLQVVTADNKGHFSLPVERTFTVYGNNYRTSLLNRVVNETRYNSEENLLEMFFSGAFSDHDRGIEIKYTETDETSRLVQIPDSLLAGSVHVSGFDLNSGVSYRTMYLPDSLAIDTFYTDYRSVEILSTLNVVLDKPATSSGDNPASNSAEKAVDGEITNASRWVSPTTGAHWLEVDLQGEYTINGFKTWTGVNGNMSHPTKNFMFQAWSNDEWVNVVEVTDNSDPEYGASFPEVATNKVRYYVPEYEGNRIRLYEMEVYSTIKY